jgi:hypothetical protein
MRTIVATLQDKSSTMYDLYDLMAIITHLSPSFHPVPSEGVVNIKVDQKDAEEALNLLGAK